MIFSFIFLLSAVLRAAAVSPEGAVLVFSRGEGGYYCIKIPYLFRTSSNVLIALGEGRGKDGRQACDDFSGTDLVYKRSFDEGRTWSELALFYSNSSSVTEEYNVIGNAAPVQDRLTGRIWVPFCQNNEEVYMTYSDDDGSTWQPPVHMPHLALPDWKWVGIGPPASIQLHSRDGNGYSNNKSNNSNNYNRLLVPGYHSSIRKGDGLLTKGHTLISDDSGANWSIGCEEYGSPFLLNENQLIELIDGRVLVNARTVSTNRIQAVSMDGGMTFQQPYIAADLTEPLEGCEGSTVIDRGSNTLYYSGANSPSPIRQNLTIFYSRDKGAEWEVLEQVDEGAVSYSAMQVLSDGSIGLLYERSNQIQLVFEPDEILFYRANPAP